MDEVDKLPTQCSEDLRTRTSQELSIFKSQLSESSSMDDLHARNFVLLSKVQCMAEDKELFAREKEVLIARRDSIIKEKEKIAKERDEAVAEKEMLMKQNEALKKENQDLQRGQHDKEKKMIQLKSEAKQAAFEAKGNKEQLEQLREVLKKTEERLGKTELELEEFRKNQRATEESILEPLMEMFKTSSRRHLYDKLRALAPEEEGTPSDSSTDDTEESEGLYESIDEQEVQVPPTPPLRRGAPHGRSTKKSKKQGLRKFLLRGRNKGINVQGKNISVKIGGGDVRGIPPADGKLRPVARYTSL